MGPTGMLDDPAPGAPERPPEHPGSGEAEINHSLRQENERLRDQVKALVRTESKLYRVQEQLDLQIKLFRKLYELGQRINSTFDLDHVVTELPPFCTYELGYQRAAVLLDDRGTGAMSVRACDGYHSDAELTAVAELLLPCGPLNERFTAAKQVVCHRDDAPPELRALGSGLDLDQFIIHPLRGRGDSLIGLLVAGNRASDAAFYATVSEESDAAYGMANLAAQASAAISNCVLYRALAEERNLLEQKVHDRTRELSEAYANLAKVDALKTQFFANVSHELRTPLTLSIAPLEELLRHGDRLPREQREQYLHTMHRNQLRLLKLINNLLDFAKIDAGRMNATFQAEDLTAAVRFYASTVEDAARSRNITLTVSAPAGPLPVFVDLDKLEKIVMNLLSNAFKFTGDGGRISVRLQEEGDWVAIDVEDTGIGIPEDQRSRIFERFSQVDGSNRRRHQGTGIGLALVREYVELHRGTIAVSSQLGQGSCFRICLRKGRSHLDPTAIVEHTSESQLTVSSSLQADFAVAAGPAAGAALPAPGAAADGPLPAPATATPAPPAAAGPPAAVAPAAPATATVLLVDDVADMRRFIGDVLASEYRVVMAEDGLQALEMARRLQPDIVVSDVMMPRMTGYELCDALKRESGELARVPVILLSAKADLATKLEGLEHGADDYLVKPFNARELQSRVRNLLHLRLHERELVRALHALEERDAIITDDLRQAREFQQSTLPELPYVPGMHLSAAYRPLHMVGGDFYDLFVTETGALRVFIADATGHGVRASLVTMCIKGEYEAIKHRSSSPGEVLRALNDRITRVYGHLGVRFTAACADIEAVHGRLDLACAAHPPPCIVRGDRAELSASGGEFLGLRPGAAVFEERHLLQAGDRVHLYTDGLTEQWNRRGESFGEEGLLRVLARHTGDGGSHAPSIVDQITEFVGGAEQLEDDLTLVSIELYEAAPGTVPAAKEGMQ